MDKLQAIRTWINFMDLEVDFLAKIKRAWIFGYTGNEAIVITNDDEVFALGDNKSGCLGIGDDKPVRQPTKVAVLSERNIIDFAFGAGPHVLALTKGGEIYSWGLNEFGQLGKQSGDLDPSPIKGAISGKVVTAVACGSSHSLALTKDGEVFAWGYQSSKLIYCPDQANSPSIINYGKASKYSQSFAVKVAACEDSSLILLNSGEVLSWGDNADGQLGLGHTDKRSLPERITFFDGLVVVKVACGLSHALALTDEGQLFAWGSNKCGQLGKGDLASSSSPVRIGENLPRIMDIAATLYSQMSAALTQYPKTCYIWGQCQNKSFTAPMETALTSMNEAFNCYSYPAVSPNAIEVASGPNPKSFLESFKAAFDDDKTSDVTFVVDERKIHAHKALLIVRCEHFQLMLKDCWKEEAMACDVETDSEVIVIQHFTYPVYRAFIKYLYCEEIDLDLEKVPELYDLANSYCEMELKEVCKELMISGINVELAIPFYILAIRYGDNGLEEFCLRFIINHFTDITQTDAFLNLDDTTCKYLIVKAAKNGSFELVRYM